MKKMIIGYPAPVMSLYQAWDLVQDSEIDADTASAVAKLITLMYQDEAPELRALAAGKPVAADALTGEIDRLISSGDLADRPRHLLAAVRRWVEAVVGRPGPWYAVSGPGGSAVARDIQCLMALAVQFTFTAEEGHWRASAIAKELAYIGGGTVHYGDDLWLEVRVQ